jgi:transketolase
MPLGNLRVKFEAFGFKVLEMDGNDMDDILETITRAKSETGKGCPVMIIMKTEMGMGVDIMMGTHKWHGVAPDDKQTEIALAQLKETLGDFTY